MSNDTTGHSQPSNTLGLSELKPSLSSCVLRRRGWEKVNWDLWGEGWGTGTHVGESGNMGIVSKRRGCQEVEGEDTDMLIWLVSYTTALHPETMSFHMVFIEDTSSLPVKENCCSTHNTHSLTNQFSNSLWTPAGCQFWLFCSDTTQS